MVRYFAHMANLRCVNTARATQQLEEDDGANATKAKGSNFSFDVIRADGWGAEMIRQQNRYHNTPRLQNQ